MNDSERLDNSESCNELPPSLLDHMDDFLEFDLLQPLSTPRSIADPETISPRKDSEDYLKANGEIQKERALKKLDFFCQNRLTDIAEENSQLEMSEIQDKSILSSFKPGTPFEQVFRDNLDFDNGIDFLKNLDTEEKRITTERLLMSRLTNDTKTNTLLSNVSCAQKLDFSKEDRTNQYVGVPFFNSSRVHNKQGNSNIDFHLLKINNISTQEINELEKKSAKEQEADIDIKKCGKGEQINKHQADKGKIKSNFKKKKKPEIEDKAYQNSVKKKRKSSKVELPLKKKLNYTDKTFFNSIGTSKETNKRDSKRNPIKASSNHSLLIQKEEAQRKPSFIFSTPRSTRQSRFLDEADHNFSLTGTISNLKRTPDFVNIYKEKKAAKKQIVNLYNKPKSLKTKNKTLYGKSKETKTLISEESNIKKNDMFFMTDFLKEIKPTKKRESSIKKTLFNKIKSNKQAPNISPKIRKSYAYLSNKVRNDSKSLKRNTNVNFYASIDRNLNHFVLRKSEEQTLENQFNNKISDFITKSNGKKDMNSNLYDIEPFEKPAQRKNKSTMLNQKSKGSLKHIESHTMFKTSIMYNNDKNGSKKGIVCKPFVRSKIASANTLKRKSKKSAKSFSNILTDKTNNPNISASTTLKRLYGERSIGQLVLNENKYEWIKETSYKTKTNFMEKNKVIKTKNCKNDFYKAVENNKRFFAKLKMNK